MGRHRRPRTQRPAGFVDRGSAFDFAIQGTGRALGQAAHGQERIVETGRGRPGAQIGRVGLVSDDGTLEPIGRSGPALVDQGLQNRQPSAARSDPTEWIERQSAASKNKGIAAGRPGLRAGSGPEISARERLKP